MTPLTPGFHKPLLQCNLGRGRALFFAAPWPFLSPPNVVSHFELNLRLFNSKIKRGNALHEFDNQETAVVLACLCYRENAMNGL